MRNENNKIHCSVKSETKKERQCKSLVVQKMEKYENWNLDNHINPTKITSFSISCESEWKHFLGKTRNKKMQKLEYWER